MRATSPRSSYVVPEDIWYVIPIRDLRHTGGMQLFPSSKNRGSKYEQYREAWWHLEPKETEDAKGRKKKA